MKKVIDAIVHYRFDEASALTSGFVCRSKKLAITEKVLFLLGGALFFLLTALEALYLLAMTASPEELLRYPFLDQLAAFFNQIDGAALALLGLQQVWYFQVPFWLLMLYALPLLLALILRLVLPALLPFKAVQCGSDIPMEQAKFVQAQLKSLSCDSVEILPYNVIFAVLSTLVPLGLLIYETLPAKDIVGTVIGFVLGGLLLFGLFLALHAGFLALCCILCYSGFGHGHKNKALKAIDEAFKLHEQTQQRIAKREAEERAKAQQQRNRTAANIQYQCAMTSGSMTGDDPYIQKAAALGHPHACLLVGELRFNRLRTAISQGTLTAAERSKERDLVLSYLKTAADSQYAVGEFLYIAANVLLGCPQNSVQWDSWLQRLRQMQQTQLLPNNCRSLYDEILPRIVSLVDQTRQAETERAFQAAREAYRQSFAYAERFHSSDTSHVTVPEQYQYTGEYGHDKDIFGNLHFVADLDYDQREHLTNEFWRLHPDPVELDIDMDQI